MNPATLSRTTAAVTLLALALAAPPATARPILDPPNQSDLSAQPRVIVRSADEGFDLGSAGIGAATTGGLVLVAGGFAAAHRARTRLAP